MERVLIMNIMQMEEIIKGLRKRQRQNENRISEKGDSDVGDSKTSVGKVLTDSTNKKPRRRKQVIVYNNTFLFQLKLDSDRVFFSNL